MDKMRKGRKRHQGRQELGVAAGKEMQEKKQDTQRSQKRERNKRRKNERKKEEE